MKKLTSISGKIVSLVSVSMIVVVSIVMMIIIPRAKSNISTVTENYMIDLATITGEQIENVRAEKGSNVAFNVGTLSRMVRNVAVSDISSSYTYVVSGEGTMLFHPTAEKIGQPVEIEAIKHLVSEIESGNIPEPSVIKYDYKGTKKYASYYINSTASFIVVVTADESEIFSGLNNLAAVSGGAAILVLLFYIGFTTVIALKIVKPITILNQEIKKLADLDFSRNPDLDKLSLRKDESGQISASVIALEEKLDEVMLEIKNLADQVYNASDNMTQSVVDSIETVGQVEHATNEIAAGAGNQAEETQNATENVIPMAI